MAERLRGAFAPFVAGVFLTLAAVFLILSFSPGTLAHFVVQLSAFDMRAWLSTHVSAPDAAAWLADVGAWLKDHKDELTGAGALAAGVGVLIASRGLIISGKAQRLAAFTSSWNSSRDCLWNFNHQWKDLIESREATDQLLRTLQPPYQWNEQLAEVLNFFEKMAFMGNRGHLDDELAWTNYFDEAYDVWKRAAGYILWRQQLSQDPTVWCEYGPWVVRLARVDARRKKIAMRRLGKRPELSAPPIAPSGTAADTATRLAPSATPLEAPEAQTSVAKTPDTEATAVKTFVLERPAEAVVRSGVAPVDDPDLRAHASDVSGTQTAAKGATSHPEPPAASQVDHPPEGPKKTSGT